MKFQVSDELQQLADRAALDSVIESQVALRLEFKVDPKTGKRGWVDMPDVPETDYSDAPF